MLVSAVLIASLALQFIAVYFALRLIRVSGRSLAWSFIAAAIALMALRRGVSLADIFGSDTTTPPNLSVELIALTISALMAIGIERITPIVASLRSAADRLRESENRYRLMFENSPISIWEEDFSGVKAFFDRLRREGITDITAYFEEHPEAVQQCAERAKIVDVNQAALTLHRADSKQELLAGIVNTFTPESFETFREELICLWRGDTEMSRDAVVKTLDGEPRQVSVKFAICPGYEKSFARIFVSLIDITERKLMERTLIDSELRLTSFIANLPAFFFTFHKAANGKLCFPYASPGIKTLYGLDPEDVRDDMTPMHMLAHPDDRPYIEASLDEAFRTLAPFHIEYRIRRPGMPERWLECRSVAVPDSDGNPLWHGIILDITERRHVAAALAASERQFRSLTENSPDNIIRYDRHCRTIYFNPRVSQTLAIDTGTVLGKTPVELGFGGPETSAQYEAHILRVLESGESNDMELAVPQRDGRLHPHLVRFSAEHDDQGIITGVLAIGRDITELKQAERERQLHTDFLANMDRINRSIQGAGDLETMMENVLDEVLAILDCDRAALAYPCDPEATSWQVSMERFKPAYPSNVPLGTEMPMTPEVAAMHRVSLENKHPVAYGADTELPIPPQLQANGDKSGLGMALYPKTGKPWGFAVIQCSHARHWTDAEIHLFEEIGWRLTDGISSLLALRDLRESEARYRRLFDTASEGIWGQDENFNTSFVNAHMAEMLGYTVGEMSGRPVTDFMFEEDLADHRQRVTNRKQHISEAYERRFRRKDGNTLWVLISAAPVFDGNRFHGSFAMMTDITSRKRTEDRLLQSEQRLRLHAEQSPLGFLEWDENFRAAEWNAACEKIFGYTREEALGRHAKDLILPVEVRELVDGVFRDLMNQTGGTHSVNKNVTKDGRIITCEWFNTTLRNKDGKAIGVASIIRDITEQKQKEDELQNYRDHLEEVVQQRTEELRFARDEAEAANKAKSVFLANMSHELRTPLNAILGFSQLMREESGLNPAQHDNLDIINRSGEHLLRLINDVLEIAKIEAGKLQLETAGFDLHSLVREVADMMRLRAQQKGLQLQLDQSSAVPRYIKGDEARLRQILVNLVSNAVKFTDRGGITIRLGTRGNARQHLRIEVEDTGHGINEADRRRLFKPFVQLAEGTNRGGTGLGLSIVHQFVQLMGGTIKVESTVGKGSLFRVELPLEAADASEAIRLSNHPHGEVTGLAPGQPAYRILIAEDQRDNQLLLAKLMTDIGLEVKIASNGEECVTLFKSWQPHLIWMDWRMPGMDGVEAARRIRQLPGGDQVKIVAVTASAFKEQQPELLEAGMDDYVRKPFRFAEIYGSLSRQLGLEFTYKAEERDADAKPGVPAPQRLATLSEELRQQLHEAVQSLDSDSIDAVIQRIAAVDAPLAGVLAGLVGEFNYPAILQALSAGQDGHHKHGQP